MKKFLAIVLALVMVFAFAACAGNGKDSTQTTQDPTESATPSDAAESDLEYIKNKGVLVVGITEFEPMDFQNEDKEWVGFDADMAKAFADSLGVAVEFQIIDWDSKVFELNGKNIDCVWNGMTLTDDVLNAMECSNAYCNNAQVVVVSASKANDCQTAEACKELNFAVESGSAGRKVAEANGYNYTEVADQATALMEVASGTCDAAIIDFLMAGAMVGEGTSYADLTYTVSLNSEEYGVGFRKGSDAAAALNDFFAASIADGTVEAVAETYGVQAALIK